MDHDGSRYDHIFFQTIFEFLLPFLLEKDWNVLFLGQRGSTTPSAMLASRLSKRAKLQEELRNIERQVISSFSSLFFSPNFIRIRLCFIFLFLVLNISGKLNAGVCYGDKLFTGSKPMRQRFERF